MRIEKRKIDELIPAIYNPRKDLTINDAEYKKIKRSIETFGYVDPIIVNERTGVIVGGHQRLKVLKELGYEEIEVSIVDLDENDEKALNIALNKIEGDWDNAKLKDLLEELDNGKIDMELTGFSYDELENLITQHFIEHEERESIDEESFDLDEEAEKIEQPVTQYGDIWYLGKHKLLCGDSANFEEVTKIFEKDEKAQICFTSPPYAEQREYDTASNYEGKKEEDYIIWFEDIANVIEKVLKKNGCFFLNIKEHAEGGERSLYVLELVVKMKKELGWKYIDQIIWRKTGMPGKWRNRLRNDFEPIHVFTKDPYGVDVTLYGWEKGDGGKSLNQLFMDDYGDVYHFAKDVKFKFFPERKGSKSKNVPIYNKENKNESATGNVGFYGKTNAGIALPSNVLDITKNTEGIDHPAMFSVKLVEWFIQVFTSRKDIIYEPFAGGGTSFIACENKDRVCYGVEISPKYCDVIVKRWEDYTGKKATRIAKQEVGAM